MVGSSFLFSAGPCRGPQFSGLSTRGHPLCHMSPSSITDCLLKASDKERVSKVDLVILHNVVTYVLSPLPFSVGEKQTTAITLENSSNENGNMAERRKIV